MPWFRRPSVPDAVRRALAQSAGERVLASSELEGGSWVAATRRLLVTAGPAGDVLVRRPWHEVDRAAFDPTAGTLTVRWVDDGAPLRLRLADARRTALAQTVRERVQSSVVLAETVTVAEDRVVRVAVRRDGEGGLFSQVVAEPGIDLDDPVVAARVDAAEGRVRSASGLPL